jgi:hypothetical protein
MKRVFIKIFNKIKPFGFFLKEYREIKKCIRRKINAAL